MPQTRSQAQATISFPKKKLSRALNKTKNSSDAKLELTNVQTVPRSRVKVLPLSPRKRLGDDNLCNTPHLPPCSPPKQGKKENGPARLHTLKGRRLVFDNQLTIKSPSKREQAKVHQNKTLSSVRKSKEITTNPEQRCPLEKESACVRLFKQEGTCYQQAKLVLNTAVPDRLPAREREMDVIKNFLREHICEKKAGSLYLSGAPGTGKTACLSRILQDLKKELKGFKTIMLNCMSLRSAQAVFPAIAQEICQEEVSRPAGKDMMRKLEKHMTAEKGPMIVLVLDEMDQLDSKGQDVLYTLFEWPWLSNSHLVLIGIANTLDLTDRILPRLQAREKCKPQLLNFPPYTKNQIVTILQDRLNQVSRDQVLDNAAIQFCARKVSAVSGDVRKALDVCSRDTGSIKMILAVLACWSNLPLLPCRRSRSGLWLPVGKVLWREQWESQLFLLLDCMILNLKVSSNQQTTWVKTATMSNSHVG
ncbi:cell division control protein 6 homolog isoform X3 [Cebus imitator]|uniref:cell division control protein 6 homolog isoform X3 n=1 Tax=Cebus imitator TaxID=2715852 RepID=UPI00080A062F|nr:cell division control protein 6 homolog isoform X3 [Cebus imitator]